MSEAIGSNHVSGFVPAVGALPRVAVVVPVYKQPGFLAEALESILAQVTTFEFVVVVVNDGCPFAETNAICLSYARAFPLKISYIHRKNGGLSAARNTGVRFALDSWP